MKGNEQRDDDDSRAGCDKALATSALLDRSRDQTPLSE